MHSICSAWKLLSRVQLFATLWTVAHQAPPYMVFPRSEYWNRLPFLSSGEPPHPGIKLKSPLDSLPLSNQESLSALQRNGVYEKIYKAINISIIISKLTV